MKLTSIERRVLTYLDQRGASHRTDVVCDLASEGSRIARNGGKINGSNGATPMIMAKWCRRLVNNGLVIRLDDKRGFYCAHAVTTAGSSLLRKDESA